MTEAKNIFISVKPKYVSKMLAGEKTIELRRRRLRVPPGTRIWIYSTAPDCKVEAYATVDAIVCGPLRELWRQCSGKAGVSREEFDAYFSKADSGWAVVLRDICRLRVTVGLSDLRRRSASFHPPQFFKRLHDDCAALELLKARSNFVA